MKIKVIIEKEYWPDNTINEVMNDPSCLEEYEDIGERLELAALACARKQKQNPRFCANESEESIAAYDIEIDLEAHLYKSMAKQYIEEYSSTLKWLNEAS